MNMILENEDLEEVLPRLKKLLNKEKSNSDNDITKNDDAKKEDFKKVLHFLYLKYFRANNFIFLVIAELGAG
jgi:hypothetical protein